MKLSGDHFGRLHAALLSAFPTSASLTLMVRTGLGENLAAIAGETDLSATVLRLITWAESRGRVKELVDEAMRVNPGNPELKVLAAQLLNWLEDEPLAV